MTARLTPYRLPLGVTTGRGVADARAGWWIEAGGGVGEIAPWPGFGAGAAAVAAALAQPLPDAPIEAPEELEARPALAALPPEVRHGLTLALLDGLARRRGLPLARLLNEDSGLQAPTHAQVQDAAQARAAVEAGAVALKLKVGGAPLAADHARVAAVRAAVGPGVALRLDANGALTTAAAEAWLDAFAALDVAWWEQPTPPGAPLPRGPAPLALDEAIRGPADVARAAAAGVAVVVLKPAFLGGLLAVRALARQAHGLGLGVCITHGFETAVGRAGTAHLAAALVPELPGLAGGLLPPGPAPLAAGWLRLDAAPGHGGRP